MASCNSNRNRFRDLKIELKKKYPFRYSRYKFMEDSFGSSRPTERVGDYGNDTSHSNGVRHLRIGRVFRRKRSESRRVADVGDEIVTDTGGQLGMIDGVFFRVMGNLFGVILFLRLGWMIGYAGFWLAILIVVLSSSLTFITSLSLSAICTNGKIAAGGAYYLISRSLGPEFGASIGVLFYVATSIATSLYLLGFAETITEQRDMYWISEEWDLRLIAFLALIIVQCICLVGVKVVVFVEKLMLFVLLATIIIFIVGVFMGPNPADPYFGFHSMDIGANGSPDFTASSPIMPPFSKDAYPDLPVGVSYRDCQVSPTQQANTDSGAVNMGVLLAVFFPAVTGIMAGANISGDLKDPSWAIPTGTISAIICAAGVYIILCFFFASAFYRITVLEMTPIQVDNVTEYSCVYGGLLFDYLLVAKASAWPPFIYFGIYAAALSSGLSNFLSAPRILQALARDRLFSVLDTFGEGYGKNQEPLKAYGVTFIIVTMCILTGDMNTVAPLITTFYLSSYAMVNYACYSAEESKSPGWRPTFRYFSKWLAFLGAIGCITMMLFLSAVLGFVTFTIGLGLYKYVEVATREGLAGASNWGPHKEAAEYNTALRSALRLEEKAAKKKSPPSNAVPTTENTVEIELHDRTLTTKLTDELVLQQPLFDNTHVKNYRPQCLVLAGPPHARPALAVLVAGLKKSRGVTVFGDVLIGDMGDPEILKLRNKRAGVSYVAKYGINAFNDVVIAPGFRDGCRSLMQLSGLGRRMRVNVVVLGFLDDWKVPVSQRVQANIQNKDHDVSVNDYSPPPSVSDYVGVIGDAFDLGLGVAVFRGEVGLLNSEYLLETVRTEMENLLTLGMASSDSQFAAYNGSYMSAYGNAAPQLEDNDILNKTGRKSTKRIDVWWLVDDGGLTIILPHILRQARSPPWDGSDIRVVAIGLSKEDAEKEEIGMKILLQKLRITASVTVVTLDDHAVEEEEEEEVEMENINFDVQKQQLHSSGDDNENKVRRSHYKRVGRLIETESRDALLVVVSLPVPPMSLDPEEYMRWIDLLSKNSEPPVLLVRGCERDVVTMYS